MAKWTPRCHATLVGALVLVGLGRVLGQPWAGFGRVRIDAAGGKVELSCSVLNMPDSPKRPSKCLPCAQGSRLHDAQCLACLLLSGQPFFVGRPSMGCEVEAGCLATVQQPVPPFGSKAFNRSFTVGTGHFDTLQQECQHIAGITSQGPGDIAEFGYCYALSVNVSDISVRLGGGYEVDKPLRSPTNACVRHSSHQKADTLIGKAGHFPRLILGPSVLNPWMYPAPEGSEHDGLPWLAALGGKIVLVVTAFVVSFQAQLDKGSAAIWHDLAERVLPSSIREFKMVKPPINLGHGIGGTLEHHNWRAAFRELVRRVEAAGPFDVALLSCGGLGMLLGAYLRATGRSAIYMGGTLQTWLGVMGGRWKGMRGEFARYARMGNWTRPSMAKGEKPHYARSVEGSAYWR